MQWRSNLQIRRGLKVNNFLLGLRCDQGQEKEKNVSTLQISFSWCANPLTMLLRMNQPSLFKLCAPPFKKFFDMWCILEQGNFLLLFFIFFSFSLLTQVDPKKSSSPSFILSPNSNGVAKALCSHARGPEFHPDHPYWVHFKGSISW